MSSVTNGELVTPDEFYSTLRYRFMTELHYHTIKVRMHARTVLIQDRTFADLLARLSSSHDVIILCNARQQVSRGVITESIVLLQRLVV
jgi:uncharacterized protein (DUF488 family)